MPLKKQEEFCRDEFAQWLKSRYPKASITWQSGHERPDFWFVIDGIKYAVEVTRIVDEHDRTVTASLWSVVDSAEEKAREEGDLSGTYVVEFSGPIKTFRNWQNALKERILEYVSRTTLVRTYPGETIEINNQVLCHIRKLHSQGSTIGCIGPDNGGGWKDDIRHELQVLLNTTVNKKLEKLKKTNYPKVLILYDLYGFAKRDLFIECVNSTNQVGQLHTVFVVQDKNKSYIAYQAQPFIND